MTQELPLVVLGMLAYIAEGNVVQVDPEWVWAITAGCIIFVGAQ